MDAFTAWVRKHFPVLLSPRFWGIALTAFVWLARAEGWMDELTGTALLGTTGSATVVGILRWLADKLAARKK